MLINLVMTVPDALRGREAVGGYWVGSSHGTATRTLHLGKYCLGLGRANIKVLHGNRLFK